MWRFIVTASFVGLALVNCKTQADSERPPERAALSAPEAPPSQEGKAPALAKLDKHLYALMDKRSCNRVMGCDPAIAILQHGRAATPKILEFLERTPLDGRYWQIRAMDILGQLGDTRSVSFLTRALGEPRWEVRARSALALGRIADQRSAAPLLEALNKREDIATKSAALFALSALKQRVNGGSAREALIALLPLEQDTLGSLNPGQFAFVAELVGAAQLRECLQVVRWGALHKDASRMSSLETLASLKDREGIPYAITRLDDPSPGVKRQALRTLRVITGRRAFTRGEHWKDWCEQRRCLAPLRALRSGSAGSTIEPSRENTRARDVRGDEEDLKHRDHREQRGTGAKE